MNSMSKYSHERNGTDLGDPTMVGRTKAKDGNGVGEPSFKAGSPLKGVPDDDNRDLPIFPGYNRYGKEVNSTAVIKKGSI